MSDIKSFEDLKCWQACTELRRYVSKLMKRFPKYEMYELVSQMRRSSRSATDNIAEGYGRFHYKENGQFCRIARGSLYELINQLITSLDEGYITEEEYNTARKLIEKQALPTLNGYINYLQSAAGGKTN